MELKITAVSKIWSKFIKDGQMFIVTQLIFFYKKTHEYIPPSLCMLTKQIHIKVEHPTTILKMYKYKQCFINFNHSSSPFMRNLVHMDNLSAEKMS